MAALSVDFSDREPTTVHVSLPGRFNLVGQQKPAALIDAEIASDQAWKKYSQALDRQLDYLEFGWGEEVSADELDHLYCELLSADATLRIERTNWNHSFTLVSLPD